MFNYFFVRVSNGVKRLERYLYLSACYSPYTPMLLLSPSIFWGATDEFQFRIPSRHWVLPCSPRLPHHLCLYATPIVCYIFSRIAWPKVQYQQHQMKMVKRKIGTRYSPVAVCGVPV